ncbi:hypothetical protein OQA88_8395 [Cercophora sp. LCS_1]
MKFLAVLAMASAVLATPCDHPFLDASKTTPESDFEIVSGDIELGGPTAPLTFRGPTTVGGPEVAIQGTAQEIYEQILEQNPSYDPWDFPGYRAQMVARGLTKRNDIDFPEKRNNHTGFLECGKGAPIREWRECYEGLNYLERIGDGLCEAAAFSCARVSCSHNCGMNICSKASKPMALEAWMIRKEIIRIAYNCGQTHREARDQNVRGRIHYPTYTIYLSGDNC